MPMSIAMKNVLQDGVVEPREVEDLAAAIGRGTRANELRSLATPQYLDALQGGVGDALVRLGRQHGVQLRFDEPIANLSGASQVLSGHAVLARGQRNHRATVITIQRALMALSSRLGKPAFALPKYGADGGYGGESEQAVRAFQSAYGAEFNLDESGKVDKRTATAIEQVLARTNVPQLLVDEIGASAPGPKTILAACDFLIKNDGRLYGTRTPFRCRDPEHAQWSERNKQTDASGSYVDVPMNGSGWKCNLAVCTAVYLAGFEPPRYPSGAYPIAVELYRYTKAVQGRNATKNVNLELNGQIRNLGDLPRDERKAKLIALLDQAKPGQLLIVDHGDGGGADGGHCRIVRDTSKWRGGEGTIECFQASHNAALDKDHFVDDFMNEKHIYLLDPVVPRDDA